MKRTNKPLPEDATKVSYILSQRDKRKLASDAKREGTSMSEIISRALASWRLNGAK